MTIDEAIKHCEEKEREQALNGCFSCAEEHKQLAEWLKELKALKENKGDLISRSALYREIESLNVYGTIDNENDALLKGSEVFDLINNAPTVEPLKIYEFKGCDNCELERPQGKWIKTDGDSFECPFCHRLFDFGDNYCGFCGADMHKPNCVRCDHFGNCEGCEKREEE